MYTQTNTIGLTIHIMPNRRYLITLKILMYPVLSGRV